MTTTQPSAQTRPLPPQRSPNPGLERVPSIPAVDHDNHTPFPSQVFGTVDQNGDAFHILVARVTYDMQSVSGTGTNKTLRYAQQQTPLEAEDCWTGEPNASSPLWESDYAPFKPRCDVLIVNAVSRPPLSDWQKVMGSHTNSNAHPQAKRWSCAVALAWTDQQCQRHEWAKQIAVCGPRRYGLMSLEEPALASEVSIHWQNAFGGEHKAPATDQRNKAGELQKKAGADQWRVDERNPVGCGRYPSAGERAPQLEVSTLKPYRGGILQGDYPPIGLSAIGRAWLPRRSLAGTYDDAWLQNQWPLPPKDFDYAYWNCAPADQQVDYLPPGTRIRLTNLFGAQQPTPTLQSLSQASYADPANAGTWTAQLPARHPCALWRLHSGILLPRPLHLDTLVIDMAAQKIYAIHRAVLSAKVGVRKVDALLMAPDSVAPDAGAQHG